MKPHCSWQLGGGVSSTPPSRVPSATVLLSMCRHTHGSALHSGSLAHAARASRPRSCVWLAMDYGWLAASVSTQPAQRCAAAAASMPNAPRGSGIPRPHPVGVSAHGPPPGNAGLARRPYAAPAAVAQLAGHPAAAHAACAVAAARRTLSQGWRLYTAASGPQPVRQPLPAPGTSQPCSTTDRASALSQKAGMLRAAAGRHHQQGAEGVASWGAPGTREAGSSPRG
jgi:hypothetical protein